MHQLLVEEEDKLAHDLELLANVKQPIKNLRALTETQRMFVAILESNGNDGGAVTARALLNGLEQSQALHTEYRQRNFDLVPQNIQFKNWYLTVCIPMHGGS